MPPGMIRTTSTDMVKRFGDESILYNWMRNRNTIEFLGIWEQIYNPHFKPLEFEMFRRQAGLNSFSLSPKNGLRQQVPSVCTPKQGAEATPMPTKTLPSSLAPGSARSSSSTSAGRAASAPSLHRNHRIASARVLPPLRRRPHRQERLCPRPAALFVPWLHMHLQRADGHAAEWAASAGQMAGAHPGAQPRPEHSPGGRAAGGGLEHGVSLASPLPAAAQSAPGQRIARHCRGR